MSSVLEYRGKDFSPMPQKIGIHAVLSIMYHKSRIGTVIIVRSLWGLVHGDSTNYFVLYNMRDTNPEVNRYNYRNDDE